VVPLYPGFYSAIGLIMSDVKHDYIQSKMAPLDRVATADVNEMFAQLEAHAAEELAADGFAANAIRIERALDMRYAGQGYEITMACSDAPLADGGLAALRQQFDTQHK